MVSAALIVASVASFVQVTQFKIRGTRFVIGSGLLSVMGVSFSFVPVAQQVIATLSQCACNGTPCSVGGGTCAACPVALTGKCHSAEDAYGKVLGTVCKPSLQTLKNSSKFLKALSKLHKLSKLSKLYKLFKSLKSLKTLKTFEILGTLGTFQNSRNVLRC